MEKAKEFLKKQGWSESDKGSFDFNALCVLLEKYKLDREQTFESISDDVLMYMSKNHHPHCTLIATSTNVEIVEGLKSTGFVDKYISDKSTFVKKEIRDASEVYPGCSRLFACGVHTWINKGGDYDQRLIHQESEEFRQGFYQAQIELGDSYKMNR